jgi:hypothetical protein
MAGRVFWPEVPGCRVRCTRVQGPACGGEVAELRGSGAQLAEIETARP